MTDEELNNYIAEKDDDSFLVYLRYKYDFEKEWTYSMECAAWNAYEDAVCWLNDWYEGQQNVEYLAISKLGEEYDSRDVFKCSNCGFISVDHTEFKIDEDNREEFYYGYRPKYCPNCGRKIID